MNTDPSASRPQPQGAKEFWTPAPRGCPLNRN